MAKGTIVHHCIPKRTALRNDETTADEKVHENSGKGKVDVGRVDGAAEHKNLSKEMQMTFFPGKKAGRGSGLKFASEVPAQSAT